MADVTRRGAVRLAALALLLLVAPAGADTGGRGPDLGDCQDVAVPAGHRVAFRTYAEGWQVYRWTGTAWAFVEPVAVLYDWDGEEVVGIHYAGPTWESNSGGTVVGAVERRCTHDPDAIPWLRLKAVDTEGPGVFRRVTYIQRVDTVGGLAPADPGEFVGEEAWVPYAADYYFYRADR